MKEMTEKEEKILRGKLDAEYKYQKELRIALQLSEERSTRLGYELGLF